MYSKILGTLLLASALSAPAFAEEPAHGAPADAHAPADDAHAAPADDAHAPADAHADDAHAPADDAHAPADDAHAPADDAHAADPHAPADAHGADAGHGADADHGDAHGDEGGHGGGHHSVDYTGDHDHDGTANWLDSDNEEAYSFKRLAFHAFNLALLIGLIVWGAGGAVKNGLAQRSASIRKELTDTARERDEARQKFEELGTRLQAFEAEVADMRTNAEAQAKAEEEALVKRAHEEATRIGETAQRNIRDETVRAKVALRKEAVALAVKLAEQTLKGAIKDDDQTRLAAQFLQSIDGEVANG
ncbi:MAG: ATP synthase F0 subunit B [Proteobacteria bacterium]|nr:ATP synthase F0 subunit B [Pseudomonadota bacterium]